jgi:hypothetical protein
MDNIKITLNAGYSKTLLTKGKMCDKNIVVEAEDSYNEGYTDGYRLGEEEGYQDGYNDGEEYGYAFGHNKGVEEGYDDGWTKGREVGYQNGHDDGYGQGKVEGVEQGVADGKQQAYDEFWDSFQTNGTRRNYPYLFAGSGWTNETYDPKYEIIVTNSAPNLFSYNSQITSTKVPITIDTTNTNTMYVFMYCSRLKTIPSLKVTEKVSAFSGWFTGCSALEEINFTEDSVIKANISFANSPLLTTTSVDSIIHALKDLTGATAQTLTLHATVKGNLTQAQKDAITAKNWTLA